MPRPSSRTTMRAPRRAAPAAVARSGRVSSIDSATCPPAGVNLIAFDSRFQITCCRREGSPRNPAGSVADRHLERGFPWRRRSAGPPRPPRAPRAEIDRLGLETQLAGDDARDVEDVLDQHRLRLGVALDRLERLARLLGREVARAQHAGPSDHRRQRRAQLVRQRGQELVLGAVGGLGLLARLPLALDHARVLVLDALLGLDVGGGDDPADHGAGVVALGDGAPHVPAERAVAGAAQPTLRVERLAARERRGPGLPHARKIVGVDQRAPASTRPSDDSDEPE